MRYIIALTLALFAFAIPLPAHGINYEQVICDEEPDPVLCAKIEAWYQKAQQPYPAQVSCCGLADAYWVAIDKVVDLGVYATVTDTRQIINRVPRNGVRIFIPSKQLDNKFQGNPTGHDVVFIGTGIYYYLEDGVGYPAIYCAFLRFDG